MDYEVQETPFTHVPANSEAEMCVLGSIMIDPESIFQIKSTLAVDDFYFGRNQLVYGAILSLSESKAPIDFITVTDELERSGGLVDAGGPAYLSDLVSKVPTALYIDHYATIVERCAVNRRLIRVAGKIAELAYKDDEASDAIAEAESILNDVSTGRNDDSTVTLGESLQKVIGHISHVAESGQPNLVPTGFSALDNILGGFHPSDLIILAARPGMGKTSLAMSFVMAAAKTERSVGVFSMEMSSEQLSTRLLSSDSKIDGNRLRDGKVYDQEWPALLESANHLSENPVLINDTPAMSISEIRSCARRWQRKYGLDAIVIDYMQLMTGSKRIRSENRQQEISYISRSLKALARELDVPVIALSQLSRAVESRMDKRPMLSDLRESGAIEQDADVVMFIYREDYYIEDTDRQNIADIIVAKHRHGGTGTGSLYFRKELTSFSDMEIERTEL